MDSMAPKPNPYYLLVFDTMLTRVAFVGRSGMDVDGGDERG